MPEIPIVVQLQRDALDKNVGPADLLRKALVVSRKLKMRELEEWISHELGGYSESETVPPYRMVVGSAAAWNPYRGWIPVIMSNSAHTELISNRSMPNSVAELEDMASSGKRGGFITFRFPHDVEAALMEGMGPSALQPVYRVATATIAGILDAVRNIVLNWSLKLEEDGILGEAFSFSEKERTSAESSTAQHVNNFYGPVSQSQFSAAANQPVQIATINPLKIEDVVALIGRVKEATSGLELPPTKAAELSADIATVEAQVKSPSPKFSLIREAMASIRTILEGAAGNVAAELLVEFGKRFLM